MRVVNWFRRNARRVVVPRLKSRGEAALGVSRVELDELTPDVMVFLGQSAYLQLMIFELLAVAVTTAPTTGSKEAVSRVASLALARHQSLSAEIVRKGAVPGEVMAPYASRIEGYRAKVHGADWHEALVTSYVTAGLLDDFFRRLATGLTGSSAVHVAEVYATEDGHAILLEQLRGEIESDPRLASRLAMWGRRLVGDTLLIARSVLAMPESGDAEAKLEPVFTELIAAHTRRMDALGLTA